MRVSVSVHVCACMRERVRERDTYRVVKDPKVENQGGTSDTSKLLLLKSLSIMQKNEKKYCYWHNHYSGSTDIIQHAFHGWSTLDWENFVEKIYGKTVNHRVSNKIAPLSWEYLFIYHMLLSTYTYCKLFMPVKFGIGPVSWLFDKCLEM